MSPKYDLKIKEFKTSPPPIGMGCYRVREDSEVHLTALREALHLGCQLIDTSTNYEDGSSERAVGRILKEHTGAPIFVVTKVGYVQGQNLIQAKTRESQGNPYPEMVKYQNGCWHCISPEFLADQIDLSLGRLGISKIDGLLLHNPEYFLKAGGTQKEYYDRIKAAFAYLETEVSRGRIRHYGISSNTLGDPKDSAEYTSLETCIEMANQVGDGSAFALIQFPFNLLEPGAAFENNNSGKSVLELAQINGLFTLTNRPLNAFSGEGMVRLASYPSHLGRDVTTELKEALQLATSFEATYPAGDLMPIREIAWAHILHRNFEKLESIEAWKSALEYQFLPGVNQAARTLMESPHAEWGKKYHDLTLELFNAVTRFLEARAALLSDSWSEALDQAVPALKSSPTLSSKVIRVYRSLPGLNSVLVGMRTQRYVRDVMNLEPLLTPEQAFEALECSP